MNSIVAALIRFPLNILQVIMFLAIGFVFETFYPLNNSAKDTLRFNVLYTLVFEVFEVSGAALVAYVVTTSIQRAPLHELIVLGSDRGNIAIAVPLVLFSVFLGDFFYYWMHRLQHRSRWLWAIHELHHSDENMNVTSAWRHHFLEKPLQTLLITAPMTLLFKPPVITLVAAAILGNVFPYFIHLGAKIDIGPLKRVFMNPHSHRIHHSRSPEHFDKNFASAFSIWDVIFGTYYDAKADEWPETGLTSGATAHTIRQAILLPFAIWGRMLRESMAARR